MAARLLEPPSLTKLRVEGFDTADLKDAKPDGNTVATRADIDADTQLQRLGDRHGLLLRQTRSSDHRLIDAWPTLGDESKRAMLALVETVVTDAD